MATRAIWLGSARASSQISFAVRQNAIGISSMNAAARAQRCDCKNIHITASARKDDVIKQDEHVQAQEARSTPSSSKQTLDQKPKSKGIRRRGGIQLFASRNSRLTDMPQGGKLANSTENNITMTSQAHQSQAFASLKENEKIFKDDEMMRVLMPKLGRQVQQLNLVGAINICTGIRHRINFLKRKMQIKGSLAPPVYVFHMLLKVLGSYGDLARSKEVLEDMREYEMEIGVTELEFLLRAAVLSGNADEVDTILSDLVALLNGNEGETGREGKDNLSQPQTDTDDQILDPDYMRNWTPRMYRIMLLQSQLSRNLEYGLALLAAAGRRSKEEEEDLSKKQLFLHAVLDLNTTKAILNLARDCRQARLMSDLALWFDEGASKHKLRYGIWMEVLRCCADEHWFPGVELAWERSIQRGLYRPDEGLCLSTLHCAARAGQPRFIEKVLEAMKGNGQLRHEMREWHLMPLFEAQCNTNDFEGALRTATKIAKLAHTTSSEDHLMALVSPFETSKEVATNAYKALLTVGRDESQDGGVILHSMNAMIRLARKTGLHEMALKVYGVRKFLADGTNVGTQVAKSVLPKLPTFYLELGMNAAQVGEPGREIIRQTITQIQDMDTVHEEAINANKRIIRPDITTFNTLLGTAVDMECRELGEFVFREINAHKVKADETTYERAIILFVVQPDYNDAYDFLQECQSKGIRPTRASFLAIGLRCLKENDDRWIRIGIEMVDHEYYPGSELRQALLAGRHLSPARLDRLATFSKSESRSRV